MLRRFRSMQTARPGLAIIMLYGLVLSAGPFLHHDFACHERSRTHCTSCQLSQFAHTEDSGTASLAGILNPIGEIESHTVGAVETHTLQQITDRSPPLSARS